MFHYYRLLPVLCNFQILFNLIIRDTQAVLVPFLPLGAQEGFAGRSAQGIGEQRVLLELGQGFGQGAGQFLDTQLAALLCIQVIQVDVVERLRCFQSAARCRPGRRRA